MGLSKAREGAHAAPVLTVTVAGRVALTTAGATVGSGGAIPEGARAATGSADSSACGEGGSQPSRPADQLPARKRMRPAVVLRLEPQRLDLTGVHIRTAEA